MVKAMANHAYTAVVAQLTAAGCPDASFDAAQLYRFVTGRHPRFAPEPTAAQAAQLQALAARRAAREPLQYILGEWDFLDFTLKVGPGVLCPRADSEVVCEAAIEKLQENIHSGSAPAHPTVLDLCAGTGCLGLGVARACPTASVTCVEKSVQAYAYLAQNTTGSTVQPVLDDAFAHCAALPANSIDLIISNPPYLTAGEMEQLMPETAKEPAMALAGGADGLDFYRALIAQTPRVLRPGGWLVLEIGCEQRAAVLALAAKPAKTWQKAQARRDYGGNDRVILLQKA